MVKHGYTVNFYFNCQKCEKRHNLNNNKKIQFCDDLINNLMT